MPEIHPDHRPLAPGEREAMLRSLISSWALSGIVVDREVAEKSLDAALRRPLPDLDTQDELNRLERQRRITTRALWWHKRENEMLRGTVRLLLAVLRAGNRTPRKPPAPADREQESDT